MLDNRESKFKFFSLGIVVGTPYGDMITVCPIEELTMANGPIDKIREEFKVNNLPDATGVLKSATTSATATIQARWLPFATPNRVTAPNVCANETVMIVRYADAEEYRWFTTDNEYGIRNQETVKWRFSNTKLNDQDKDGNPTGTKSFKTATDDTSYWFTVSTSGKTIHLHTAVNDKEFAMYDVGFDTAKGLFTFTDNKKNFFTFDSKAAKFTIHMDKMARIEDKRGNYIELDTTKDIVTIKAARNIILDGDVIIKGDFEVKKAAIFRGKTNTYGVLNAYGGARHNDIHWGVPIL